jgi:hypothetical protein
MIIAEQVGVDERKTTPSPSAMHTAPSASINRLPQLTLIPHMPVKCTTIVHPQHQIGTIGKNLEDCLRTFVVDPLNLGPRHTGPSIVSSISIFGSSRPFPPHQRQQALDIAAYSGVEHAPAPPTTGWTSGSRSTTGYSSS